MTAHVTASRLQRMESDEFTNQLAKRLDTQDADTEIVIDGFRFKAAADKALVNVGMALEILSLFVGERVRGVRLQPSPMLGMRVAATRMDYRGILKKLLSSYLSEDECEDHNREFRTATAQSWEDDEMFGCPISELENQLGKIV
eukprot:contig_2968_g622